MAVDTDEFENARALLARAIEEEYADAYLIQPVEVAPGHWALWPHRKVEVRLEETRYWTYGQPGAGTGQLQAHVRWPHDQHERIKPKPSGAPFDEKAARRAARSARHASDIYVSASGKSEVWARRTG